MDISTGLAKCYPPFKSDVYGLLTSGMMGEDGPDDILRSRYIGIVSLEYFRISDRREVNFCYLRIIR